MSDNVLCRVGRRKGTSDRIPTAAVCRVCRVEVALPDDGVPFWQAYHAFAAEHRRCPITPTSAPRPSKQR